MNRWERKLRREGLSPSRGRDTRLDYGLEPRLDTTHGLVSSLYALSPSGAYWSDDERRLRARKALKCLILKHGRSEVEHILTHCAVAKSDEPVRQGLVQLLRLIPDSVSP